MSTREIERAFIEFFRPIHNRPPKRPDREKAGGIVARFFDNGEPKFRTYQECASDFRRNMAALRAERLGPNGIIKMTLHIPRHLVERLNRFFPVGPDDTELCRELAIMLDRIEHRAALATPAAGALQ